ncbi:Cyclic di-GMP phosphodiesterase response regulator RpfG, partial [Durusdinium trenchii]
HKFDQPSLAFLCGLLRDIGKLALDSFYGSSYLSLLDQRSGTGATFVEQEHRSLGFDHATVGAELVRRWNFPDRVAFAIEHHHAPPKLDENHDDLCDLVHTADTICLWAGIGTGVDGLEYRLSQHVREGLGIDRRSAERLIATVWQKLSSGMNCNVLIVDDSAILRKAIRKVVRLAGIEDDRIHDAGNGQEALEVLETVWIDLVLLDMNMPVMDGEQFATELRKNPDLADVAIVVVSTEANKNRLDRMRELGVIDVLRKPFEPEDLHRLIPKVLGVKL